MSFLPEDDAEYLKAKQISHELKQEKLPDGTERRGVVFPSFAVSGNLQTANGGGQLAGCTACDLLILIPPGYSTTKLDSFYTRPFLKKPGGSDPQAASGQQDLFGQQWQFWSRHLADGEWRVGQDGLETFLQYVRSELQRA
jgi:hypothetical protein